MYHIGMSLASHRNESKTFECASSNESHEIRMILLWFSFLKKSPVHIEFFLGQILLGGFAPPK